MSWRVRVKTLYGWEVRARFKFRDEAASYAEWLRRRTRFVVAVEAE